MAKIKICGITNLKDALTAVNLEVDALGFVFYPPSPRAITPDKAQQIRQEIPPFTLCVGVFVNESREEVMNVAKACRLDALQFHGNESPDYCAFFPDYKVIKAFSLKDKADMDAIPRYSVQAYLVDAYDPKQYGGTGKKANWELARAAKDFGPVILAGGLDEANVSEAIREVNPYAVDVSSGVELSPGIKDPAKLRRFVEMVRRK
ncbi:MAG: phosphoribosylanthranilate isomerase [Thermodesulfobacteriota bacterium]|jgi:phosphoribosylanthranilate isomerase|nr:MAG: phosphoribosylanthranilate isomerase [Thermodesulfobacteriota bacterium]